MRWWKMQLIYRITLLSLLIFLFIGCATRNINVVKNTEVKTDTRVIDRMSKYWSFRDINDYSAAYEMEAPFVREMLTFDKYKNYIKMFHGETDVAKIDILSYDKQKNYYGCLNMDVLFIKQSGNDKRNFDDCWVKVNNTWYHVLRNKLLFPFLEG